MGYIIVLILGIVVMVAAFIGIVGGSRKPSSGRLRADVGRSQGQPSADAPTPGASVIESNRQAENARRSTPPA